MSSYREQSSEAKDKRRGILEQRAVGGRSRKDKPVVVEDRIAPGHPLANSFPAWGEWSKFGRYRSVDEAQRVIDQQSRKFPFMEFRIKEAP